MDRCILDAKEWAMENFGECDFGDKRLTNRLVSYAEACAIRPDDATPQQTQEWKHCKGTYRFMDNKKVTFKSIIEPHCRRTRAVATAGVWLSLCDTTEVSFSNKRNIKRLGKTGDNSGQGFFLHSSVLVADDSDEIVGLGGQELFYRIPMPPGENSGKRKQRARQSEVWGRIADQVGKPHDGARIIHVCDRAADDFEFFSHCQFNSAGWIVRAQHMQRKILPFDSHHAEAPHTKEKQHLDDYVKSLESLGTYELSIKKNKAQSGRTVKVEVRCGQIWMPRTIPSSPWVKKHGAKFIRMGVVEVREAQKKKGTTPISWTLLTDEPTTTFEDGWRTIARYEKRPLIEEYHKAAKTGAQMENRLYRTNKRLERVVGVLSVVAMRLLQMKTAARVEPDRPAKETAPRKWVTMVCMIQRQQCSEQKRKIWNPKTISTRDFLRGIAMLGGFLARKCDGEPGWITLWRGVKELQLALRARKRLRIVRT
jgi:Transposase DNA-binding/Transposase Tn5 dimerisation domain